MLTRLALLGCFSAKLNAAVSPAAPVAVAPPPPYAVRLMSHTATPVLSKANPVGAGHSDCLVFNPSVVHANPPLFNRSGLLVRLCCGAACTGHGARSAGVAGEARKTGEVTGEMIGWADCDLEQGTCSDVDKDFVFSRGTHTEDPRAVQYGDWVYLFYYDEGPARLQLPCKDTFPPNATTNAQCTVSLSRSQNPLDEASWRRISTLPWHRNGCCFVRPQGEQTFCMWGEGPGPFPGLGISVTTDLAKGDFTQVQWKNASSTTPSPVTADGMWLLPLGSALEEIKLEAGTHMHQLSSGDLITFYAAATPGWVPNGNYTVGFLVLDGQDPTRIKQRSTAHVLVPTFDFETLCNGDPDCKYSGERKNVIFSSSAMPAKGSGTAGPDDFRLFFGGGDGNVGTAVVRIEPANATASSMLSLQQNAM